MIVLAVSSLSFDKIYSQEVKNSEMFPLENLTENQKATSRDIQSVPSVSIIVELVKDSDALGFIGQSYKPQYNLIWISLDANGYSNPNFYSLTDSGINRLEVSDTKIYPSFSFKLPIGPNNNTQSIEKISLFFDVNYITKIPNGLNYVGTTNVPIILNNSEYRDLYLEFDQYNNGSAILTMLGYQTPEPLE